MRHWQALIGPSVTQPEERPLDLAFAISTLRTSWPPCREEKGYVQEPDTSKAGLDVLASYPTVLADDFVCSTAGVITNIVFWGPWSNDEVNPNVSLLLGLWEDVPAVGTEPSHPGKQIIRWWFHPGQYLATLVNDGLQERFYDPNTGAIRRRRDDGPSR